MMEQLSEGPELRKSDQPIEEWRSRTEGEHERRDAEHEDGGCRGSLLVMEERERQEQQTHPAEPEEQVGNVNRVDE